MRRRLAVRGLVVLAVLGAFEGTASIAKAQVAIGPIPNPGRRHGVRLPSQLPYWINRQDCLNDDVLTFSMTLSGPFTQFNFEVWAGGADCTPTTARIGTTATCWKVASALATGTPFSIDVRVQDIVAANKPDSTVPANDQGVKPGNINNCTSTSEEPPQKIILNFMFVQASSGQAQQGAQVYNTGYDIWGPAPPTGIVARSGETRLFVDWTRSTSDDIIGYNLYCDPPPGQAGDGGLIGDSGLKPLSWFPPLPGLQLQALDSGSGAGGAVTSTGGAGGVGGAGGSLVDSGAGGTTTTQVTGPTCNSRSPLTPGRPFDASLGQYLCGNVTGKQASTATIENLINGVDYTVGVVGYDSVLNNGVLSGQICAQPQQITDFFEFYRQNGGSGGGGLCSIGSPASRAPGMSTLFGGMAAAWLLRRLGRRR